MKAVTMTHNDLSCGRGDGEIGDVGTRLTTPEHHHGLVNAKLLSLLELRRMEDGRHLLDAGDVGHVRHNMKSRAYCDGVALPNVRLSCRLVEVGHDMSSGFFSCDGLHSSRQMNVRPELEVGAVVVQILYVSFGAEEI